MPKRAIIMIIDACGIGSMPDWMNYDEVAESNTLGSVCKWAYENAGGIKLPNLQKMGIANIVPLAGLAAVDNPTASFGKMAELNPAKDTITGHWEMVGIQAKNPFPYYPNGFPDEIIEEFKAKTGLKGVLCNSSASGTEVINRLGDEHASTGFPIVYTSADSVLQIASNVEVIDLETQYKHCEIAREIMRGDKEVARIIARPFRTNPDFDSSLSAEQIAELPAAKQKYIRLNEKRHDYSVLPHGKSVLETVLESGGEVLGLGKIQDIFAGQGVPKNIHTDDNPDGLKKFIDTLQNKGEEKLSAEKQIIFLNLVETDCNYGHRRDPEGYAKALEEIDLAMPKVLAELGEDDLLFITADHGCDPLAAGTDHTREYVPLLVYSPNATAKDLGTRATFADIGATILDFFSLKDSQLDLKGTSCL